MTMKKTESGGTLTVKTGRKPTLRTIRWTLAALSAAFLICAADAAEVPTKRIHTFTGAPGDGERPTSLVFGGRGSLYGSAVYGGTTNAGTVFSMTPPAAAGGVWTENLIYSFSVLANGTFPTATVVAADSAGVLGFTEEGGNAFLGTVFALTPPSEAGGQWTETDLYDFSSPATGEYPTALIVANGVIYGTTGQGGSANGGDVFSLTPPASPGGPWVETVLYSFAGGSDGIGPQSLQMGPDGIIYGTTGQGGTANAGVVFSLTPPAAPGGNWSEGVLYAFQSGSDGNSPMGVTIGSGGVLYGTTLGGGIIANGCPFGCGTVFSLTPPAAPGGAWTEAVLYSFNGASDGYGPPAGPTLGSGGVLYGVTGDGDNGAGGGVAFSLTPPSEPGGAWTETVLHSFQGARHDDGLDPDSRLLLSGNGVLYGTALLGGFDGEGTVFELKP
jgi:uncharacterized repeat protein (TIGR03803 family)